MATTKEAGVFLQIVSIPFLVLGFVFTVVNLLKPAFDKAVAAGGALPHEVREVLAIGSGVSENGMSTLLWPGSAYFAAFLIGVWMLRAGQRASRQKAQ